MKNSHSATTLKAACSLYVPRLSTGIGKDDSVQGVMSKRLIQRHESANISPAPNWATRSRYCSNRSREPFLARLAPGKCLPRLPVCSVAEQRPRSDRRHRTQGEQLAGIPDTEHKRALLKLLSDKFDRTPLQGGQTPLQEGSLGLEEQAIDFSAAVVLFSEIDC